MVTIIPILTKTNRIDHNIICAMQRLLDSLQGNKKMGEIGAGVRWLNAHEDRSAGVRTFTGRCLALCDAMGTGDHCLVVAEPKFTPPLQNEASSSSENKDATSSVKNVVSGRLRVFRGAATLCSDRPLQGAPSSLVAFYTNETDNRVPAIAVSIGSEIYFYKNNTAYFIFNVPALPVTALEQDVWNRLIEDPSSITSQIEALKSLRFKDLSSRSQTLLSMASNTKEKDRNLRLTLHDYVAKCLLTDIPQRTSVITCMASLNKNSVNSESVSCLVVATEAGHVYFLDPQGLNILHQASATTELESPGPAIMACSGMFDVEYRCVICLRDGSVWILRRDWLEGRKLLQAPPGSAVVEMVMLKPEQYIVLGLVDGSLLCYTKRGKKLWTVHTGKTTAVTCLSVVPLPHLNTCLIAVGIRQTNNVGSTGIIQLYQGRNLVDTLHLPDIPSAVKFGRLGQEENILVIITKDGSLLFKILKRTADFSSAIAQSDSGSGAIIPSKPLPLPKRSKLFAEQAQRERLNAQAMHQAFQQDLIRLRLAAGNATVQALGTADHSVSDSLKHPIKLAAQVLGLGPKFTLTLSIENLSNENAVMNLSVVLHAQINKYKIGRPYIPLPLIPPELAFKVETSVIEILEPNAMEIINEDGETSGTPIRVFVVQPDQAQPVLAATINMPPTDPLAFMV